MPGNKFFKIELLEDWYPVGQLEEADKKINDYRLGQYWKSKDCVAIIEGAKRIAFIPAKYSLLFRLLDAKINSWKVALERDAEELFPIDGDAKDGEKLRKYRDELIIALWRQLIAMNGGREEALDHMAAHFYNGGQKKRTGKFPNKTMNDDNYRCPWLDSWATAEYLVGEVPESNEDIETCKNWEEDPLRLGEHTDSATSNVTDIEHGQWPQTGVIGRKRIKCRIGA